MARTVNKIYFSRSPYADIVTYKDGGVIVRDKVSGREEEFPNYGVAVVVRDQIAKRESNSPEAKKRRKAWKKTQASMAIQTELPL